MSISRRDLLTAAGALVVSEAAGTVQAAPISESAPTGANLAPPEMWDLRDLYPTPEAWTAEKDRLLAELPAFDAYQGRLGTDPSALKACLQRMSDLERTAFRLSDYASLAADYDTSIASAQERRQIAAQAKNRFHEAVAFFEPEILSVGATRIAALEQADPGLAKFRFQLSDILRRGPHTLGGEAELVLAAAETPLGGAELIRDQLLESDIPWPEVPLSTGKVVMDDAAFTAACDAANRDDRRLAYGAFFGTFRTYKTSLAAALATKVQSNVFYAKARRYEGALAASLSERGGVPASVYRTLVEETNRGLPALHRYFELRRRLLALPDLHYYDLATPLAKQDVHYDLATTRALTLRAVAPLGGEYVEMLAKATASPWADYSPRKNKASGAYMSGSAYDVHPYLLLNLTGNFDSLRTFAHEWGHAMHTLLANRAQPFETAEYRTFTAEIASTMNEQLLVASLVAGARSKADKLFYLGQLLELFRAVYFRQAMFAEFELEIHEVVEKGEALSGEGLSTRYLDILKKYHGPGVVIDPTVASEWASVPHFYYNFYVYQYATSIAASAYFYQSVTGGGAAERETYLGVLRAGGSDYPAEVLKKAGLDMTKPAPYRAIVARFSQTLDQVEALL